MFGRKKMYKKGLADAMQAYEAFGKKQEEALTFMREEVRSGNKELKDALAGLGEDLNGIYQYLNAQEKAALYQLSTPMDIKELDDTEKRFLLAVLYQLAENEGSALTDDQRAYIRSIQKYLELTNPQTFADLSAIENIDSIDVQKTFLRVVLEFFYLQDGDELSDEQEEIFDYFSVNKKQATIVENEVSRLFNAVGPEGVAEKYGYVPDAEPLETVIPEEINISQEIYAPKDEQPLDISGFEEIIISSPFHIPSESKIIYKNKIIHIQSDIKCEGHLKFDNCVIHYGENSWYSNIQLTDQASFLLQNSIIENHSCNDKMFIVAAGSYEQRSSQIEIYSCVFINCWSFLEINNKSVKLNNCKIINAGAYFIKNLSGTVSLDSCGFIYNDPPAFYPVPPKNTVDFNFSSVIYASKVKITECLVQNQFHICATDCFSHSMRFYSNIPQFIRAFEKSQISNSTFKGCVNLFYGDKISVAYSEFLHCERIFSNYSEVRECQFDHCSHIGEDLKNSKIQFCQFNSCFNQLLSTDFAGGVALEYCEFNNWQTSQKSRPEDNENCSGRLDMLHFKREDKNASSSSIKNCSFNGIIANDCFIISSYLHFKLKYGYAVNVENCKFNQCTTKRDSKCLIKRYAYPRFKIIKPNEPEVAVSVYNCQGLDCVNQSSGVVGNYTKKIKTATGQPIGASIKVENIGIPGYTHP